MWQESSDAMARSHLPLAMGLALIALCLLALSPDARADPRGRRTGERQDLAPNDPQVQRAAQAAVASYNMGSNSLYYFRDTNVIKAQSQLVAGIKYYLTVEMESTACRKTRVSGDHVDLTTCPLATGVQQEKLRCDFEILEVPWKNSSQLLKHNCVQV
ncbi:cystatin-M isoform 2-T2 [Callospermophilus lateralis]|uniref:cystatin-M isoform X2 n=1 Tax=Callospermophilus lateralis TaxID=76772 RepID=UPI004038F9C3